jgi:hypothetical protein
MKPINERKMDMNRGEVDSEAFFPEAPHHKKLGRAGEIRGFKYPDTEEAVMRDQTQAVSNTSKNMPKPEFRH